MAASVSWPLSASAFWGALATRYNLKHLFMIGLLSRAVLIFIMGLRDQCAIAPPFEWRKGSRRHFHGRLHHGVSSSSPESAAKNLGLYQNSLTMGGLIGRPGRFAAASLGYKGAFISAARLSSLPSSSVSTRSGYKVQIQGKGRSRQEWAESKNPFRLAPVFVRDGPADVPSEYPSNVFDAMAIGQGAALKWSGMLIMAYTATAMIGTYFLCRFTSSIGGVRLIIWMWGSLAGPSRLSGYLELFRRASGSNRLHAHPCSHPI